MKTSILFSCFCFLLLSTFCVTGQTLTPGEAKEKIAKAMPSPLPQTPALKKATTDSADDGLKGRVKSIVTSKEYPNDKGSFLTQSEASYDKAGNRIEEINYDYRGNPFQLTVYGFIDGKRVSKTEYIRYDYDPPAAAAPPGSKNTPNLPQDDRYQSSYEYSYDNEKRIVERRGLNNSGVLLGKTVYKYDGDSIQKSYYDGKGQINRVSSETYDKKENLVEVRYPASNQYGESVYKYEYTTFDSHGNWTLRKLIGKEGRYGGGQKDFEKIESRVITYF